MEKDYMANKKLPAPRSLGRMLNFATGECNALCQAMLSPHGLSLPQWVLMSALWREDGLTIGDLAAYTGNNAPATSRIVDRMIEKGLLNRTADRQDRRSVRITLTSDGRKLDHLATFFLDVNAILTDGFSQDEQAAIFDLLRRVERNADRRKKSRVKAAHAAAVPKDPS